MIVLPLSEHEKLIKDSTSPDIDHIKLVAEKQKLTVLTNSAFKDLTERVENPTLDQIKEAAEKNNQVVVLLKNMTR